MSPVSMAGLSSTIGRPRTPVVRGPSAPAAGCALVGCVAGSPACAGLPSSPCPPAAVLAHGVCPPSRAVRGREDGAFRGGGHASWSAARRAPSAQTRRVDGAVRDRPPIRATARMGGQPARVSALAGGHGWLQARGDACRRVHHHHPSHRGIVGVRGSPEFPMPSCRRACARRRSSPPRLRAARRTVPFGAAVAPRGRIDRPDTRWIGQGCATICYNSDTLAQAGDRRVRR